ncbi:hypothetical protein BaRGS_00006186 [Batillaria attramentaria]|uniref:Uncharacterized protein n=1 Tax=Batillaria attramentaria TaxID=370345 RepID=A0ABD0LTP4_9CAEN
MPRQQRRGDDPKLPGRSRDLRTGSDDGRGGMGAALPWRIRGLRGADPHSRSPNPSVFLAAELSAELEKRGAHFESKGPDVYDPETGLHQDG